MNPNSTVAGSADPGCEISAARGCEASRTRPSASAAAADLREILAYFEAMLDHCHDFADTAKRQGRPIVGIMCEFTPRELILAAGAVPVCLCGGSAATIPAAEQFLPANLCPLIKSTFGYHVNASNPFLEWADLVVAETTCDGKKKMFELMGASRPMYVLELPHKAEDADALEQWIQEVRKFKVHLEQRFQVNITDQKLRDAIQLMNRERRLRRQLADLMVYDPPPLTGRQLIEFKSIISGIEADLQQYERALRLFRETLHESQRTNLPVELAAVPLTPSLSQSDGERVAVRLGEGDSRRSNARDQVRTEQGVSHGPVRVLLTGVPLVHGAERVLELIEACGAVVVAMENCTGLKPILEDVDENDLAPIGAIARKYYHLPCSVQTPNKRRIETLRNLAAKFRPHCVIELVWQACLTYDIESHYVRKLAEEELRLPYLKITTDYSPSDSARITARVEALIETVRAHAGS